MARKRRSDCALACTLDVIGDRWTLLVLRDLFLGKRRFDELASAREGIATNVLSDRLRRLAREGLVSREADPGDARRVLYSLTARGQSLGLVLKAMASWGLEHIQGTRSPSLAAGSPAGRSARR